MVKHNTISHYIIIIIIIIILTVLTRLFIRPALLILTMSCILSRLLLLYICWPLPSNQSFFFYRQIASYVRGVRDPRVGK